MRHRGRWIIGAWLVALVGASAVGVLAPRAARGDPPGKKGTLQGYVEDEKRKPIAGVEASVDVPGGSPVKAVSDAKGNFTLPGVPVGSVVVRFRAKGYLSTTQSVVVAGKGTTRVLETLRFGISYGGKVSDAEGAPVAGALVRAGRLALRGSASSDRDEPAWEAASATTGADGTFELDGLTPGERFVIRVAHPRFANAEVRDLPSKAGTVKNDLAVSLECAAWLTGVVLDDKGAPVAKARIRGSPQFNWIRWSSVRVIFVGEEESEDSSEEPPPEEPATDDAPATGADGKFLVGGFTGSTAELLVDAEGFLLTPLRVDGLETGKERSGVEVRLEKAPGPIEGVVVDSKGRPVPDAWVYWSYGQGHDVSEDARAGKSGAFRLSKVRVKDEVTLRASAHGFIDREVTGVKPGAKGLKIALDVAPRWKAKVWDENDAPVPRLTVRVRRLDAPEGEKRGKTRFNLVQEDKGCEVTLPVGRVEVTIEAAGFQPKTLGPYTVKVNDVVSAGTVVLTAK